MPRRRRKRREPTHNWQEIQQQSLWPEQEQYEQLRPMLLFGETSAERAKETATSERTLRYQADQFEQYGMISLFPSEHTPTPVEPGRNLPPEMCLIFQRLERLQAKIEQEVKGKLAELLEDSTDQQEPFRLSKKRRICPFVFIGMRFSDWQMREFPICQ